MSSVARIRGDTEHLFGGRVHRRECAGTAGHELAVDEQLTLTVVQQAHSYSPLLLLDNCPTTFHRTITLDSDRRQDWTASRSGFSEL